MRPVRLTIACLALGQAACTGPADSPAPAEEPDETTQTTRALEELSKAYEDLTALIDRRSDEAVDRVGEDIENLGDWEYRVVDLASGSPEAIEERLNALGDERWEAYWVESSREGIRVYLKRPSISYLSRVPLSTLIRLIAAGTQ